MSHGTTIAPRGELRALLHVIRESWTEEERQRRRRIADEKQNWLLGVMQQGELRKQAS